MIETRWLQQSIENHPTFQATRYWDDKLSDNERRDIQNRFPEEVEAAGTYIRRERLLVVKHIKILSVRTNPPSKPSVKEIFLSIMNDNHIDPKISDRAKEVCTHGYNEILQQEGRWYHGLSLFSFAMLERAKNVALFIGGTFLNLGVSIIDFIDSTYNFLFEPYQENRT